MFKIESYITPLLMGYVDKYVKLRPEDFQLSLWGGDAVLNNLDLRLDMIERAIQLPITFKSGYVHELRIHVPWTKLGSEPVVITINTIECILKLRDKAYEDTRGSRSKHPLRSRSSNQIKAKSTGDEDLPPGYLQSLMNKIINNVSIIVNNLIVKFVEDDIVLSLNVKSAECYSVDKIWNRAFTDLSAPDFILRKSVNFCDLTVCLDKCDASGRIETYQDPLIYRCSVTGRVYTKYNSLTSKLPSVTKFDVFCDKLDVSLTDTQLPMFFRLIELCIALYYGTREYPGDKEAVRSDSDVQEEEEEPSEEEPSVSNQSVGDDQGWAAWAWSYVPQILPSEEEEFTDSGTAPKRKSPPILSIGMYAHKASVTFKLTEVLKDKHQFGPKKIAFRPFMLLEGEGITMEILLRGLAFFDLKVGFSNCQLLSQGNCICGAEDEGDTRSQVLLRGGSPLQSKSILNYYSQSLFDLGCPANQDAELQFLFDFDEHLQSHSEQYVTERFGAFYLDYLYTMPDANTKQETSKSSVASDLEDVVFVNENSLIRYIVGPVHLNVSSSVVHRIQKFISCAKDHTYEPYAKVKPEVVDENSPPPTEEQVRSLESFIPTSTHHVTLLNPTANIFYAEHQNCDVKKRNYHTTQRIHKTKEDPQKQSLTCLPSIAVAANRFDYQISSAMYPRKLVKLVSKTVGPSTNLLHHCYSHTQLKLFGLSAGIVEVDKAGVQSHLVTVIPPCSGALYMKKLLLSVYWNNAHLLKGEHLYQLGQLSVNLNKANLLLGKQIWTSWQQKSPKLSSLTENSLMEDIFNTDKASNKCIPLLEMSLSGLELKKCWTTSVTAYSGTVSSVQVIMYDINQTKPTPLLYAPANTSRLHMTEFFRTPTEDETSEDFLMFTFQLPNKQKTMDVPSVLLLSMEGIVCQLDPALINWLSYNPRDKMKLSSQGREKVTVDQSLAHAALPLKTKTSQVSLASSDSVTPNTDTPTVTHSTAHVPTTQGDEGQKVREETDRGHDLSNKLAALFPFIRMLQVQVDIKSCCVFVNKGPMSVPDPSVYIPKNFLSALEHGQAPGTVVICLPNLHLVSSGVKQVHALQELPITSMDGSLVGEKLPWMMTLNNFSIYTLLSTTAIFSILKPVSVNCTVAVSTKYSPPTSDIISALGLCLHTDMRCVTLACSKPQVQLCLSVGIWLNTLLKQVLAFFKSMSQPEKVKVNLTPRSGAKEPSNPTSLHREQPNMASITEDVELTETGTSGELTSREATPIRDMLVEDMTAEGVKLSLWLQWTLPKLEMCFYKQGGGSEPDTKVSLLMEDLMTSVDVEVIYAKVKVTCGGCCMHHYSRNCESPKTGSWTKGTNLGILMSSQKELASDIHVVTHKVWSCDTQNLPGHMTGESNKREINRRFITLTFTRALCKNVKQKLRKLNSDLAGVQEVGSELYFHKHISEVCLSVEPCDFLFNIPALLTVLDCFTCVKKSGSSPKSLTPKPVVPEADFVPMVTSSLLPLLYVDMASIRVFMPVKHSGDQDATAQSKKDIRLKSTADHDLIVGFIHSINVTPQADNPLPRYTYEKELYSRAMHHGIDRVPGSSVENRQYQMEFRGLSLCTGCWSDFLDQRMNLEQSEMTSPTVQIPALEWNTLLKPQNEKTDIQLLPLVASLDMKIVAAPAIMYTSKDDSQSPILVCGHTIELNASSDIDVFISTNQIHLMERWISQSKALLLPTKVQRSDEEIDQVEETKLDHMTSDSGIGSECSALTFKKAVPPVPTHHMTTLVQSPKFMTPFDLLLTAGRISCTMYTHKILEEDFHGSKDKGDSEKCQQSERNRPSYSFLNIHDMKSETEKVIKSGSCVIQPFLYLYFSQPHTVLKCQPEEQTFEMSCYDVLIKGPGTTFIEVDDKKIIPDCSDYQLYWIETRSGKPHPKTGIPPSLYTLRVNNFLKDTACVNLKVERPLKVNLSEEKLGQLEQFITDLIPTNKTQDQETEAQDKTPKSKLQGRQLDLIQVGLSKLERLQLQTDQIVITMETGSDFCNSGITGFVDGVRLEIGLDQLNTGCLESVEAYLQLKDLKVKTVYKKHSRTLLHPCSVTVDMVLEWYKNSNGLSRIPALSATITTGLVSAVIGQEHFLCFTSLQKQLERMLEKKRKPKGKIPSKTGSTRQKDEMTEKEEELILEQTTDDLRSGQFQYVQNLDAEAEARSGEITFCSRNSSEDSCMTWCYDEPRVISHVRFTPIPFNIPQETRVMEESETLIPCTLQYQETSTQQYLPYVDFELSEDTQTILQLPEVKVINVGDLVVAQVWRVVIHNSIFKGNRSNDEETAEVTDLAIFPESLAASMCVDSCYVPSLIPSIQAYLSVPAVEVHLQNQMAYLGKDVPEKLKPFTFDESSLEDQEFAVLSTRQLTLTASVLNGPHANTCIQMNGIPEMDVIEYKTLTRQNVIKPFEMFGDITFTPDKPRPLVESNITVNPVMLSVGRGTVHTLSSTSQAWSQMMLGNEEQSQVVNSYYVISNDTHHSIRFGQVGTDENLVLMSRRMHCYSWRTHKSKQQLHMCLDGKVWKWCEPFDVESVGQVVRSVRTNDQIYSLIIYITQLTNVQKQVTIRGQLMLFSCLTLPLEVKVKTTTNNGGNDLELNHNQQLPSFVLEPEEVQSIKLRPLGSHGNWSHDVYITGDRMKENRTVKIHQADSSHFHIWCRVLCSHFNSTVNTKVLFSPLFVVRSHLPRPVFVQLDTPKLKAQQQLEIPGQGRELQLYCSGSDVSHSLTFKLKNKNETSSQAITLTTGLINQVARTMVSKMDVDKLAQQWKVKAPQDWPYCFESDDSSGDEAVYSVPSGGSCTESLDVSDVDSADLTMTLNINLSEYWPGADTLLVNLTPWCLMTNQSDLDLIVMDATGSQWTLPSGKTFSPPKFEGEIILGLRIGSGVVCSGSIPLSDEEVDLQRYRPDIGQVLYLDGYVHTRISITQANRIKVYFLTVQSSVRHRMRLITILESMCVTNLTGQPYQAMLHCVCPRVGQIQRMTSSTSSEICIPDHSKVDRQDTDLCPLLQWSLDHSQDSVLLQEEDSLVHYLSLQPIKTENCDIDPDWSHPVRLLANKNAVRATVAVPRPGQWTEPICITGQERNGVAYFVMRKDNSPSCLLHNSTNLPVYYGHHNVNITYPGITVQEETELVGDPPFIPVGQNVFYTPNLINGIFGEDISNTLIPSLHFAVNRNDIQQRSEDGQGQGQSDKCLVWSRAIDVNSNMEMFVPIPGCIDIKVKVRKVAMVTSITIEPISKAEVSAKEIRSRLTGQERTVTTVAEELPPDKSERCYPVHNDNQLHNLQDVKSSATRIDLTIGVRLRHLTIALKDESSRSEEVAEVLRISMDELFMAYYPSGQVSEDESESHSCISACVGVIQLDNQLFYTKGLYDFPVLFLPQNIPDPSQLTLPSLQNLSISEKFAVLKSVSFLHIQVVMGTDLLQNSVTKRIEFGLQPATANIDDGFVLRLLKEVESLIPTKLTNSSMDNKSMFVKKLPKSFGKLSMALSSPVKIEHLCIQPIALLFSLHASLKLFIASDRTPLSFGKFERKDVCGTSHQVIRVLAMHYATGALFRAGIVVGSLEILGNPTGLIRSIGTGVADLVKMPYTGLTHGPGAFVSGVTHGMTSFVKNISSGMLMSVTSFASSVSRNMDRLSLDQYHQERQEERRRQQPHGISSGLKQGLTGFGMSLLGAVAGLADQPIQNIISNQDTDERPKSTSAAATGVVTGVGKGLVGAFTKPIGGAAELLSQTGQGILLGTGLAGDLPKVRYAAEVQTVSSFCSCRHKYLGKLLQTVPSNDLLTSMSATFLDVSGSEVRVELLITNELLFVMNCEEDCQQQAFSLAELEVKSGNPNLLTLLWKDHSHQRTGEFENENKDRVEDFIDGAADYVQISPPRSPSGVESQSDMSVSPADQVVPQFNFLLEECQREAFISTFNLAKKRNKGVGFDI
ncbi:vacuolar protein sorting-associated protein 13B-like isoform X2 [Pecten maximus]|uniref:vacuolar protein sorting-associated protein 13B-like isoform X2 n=1 Tax=Pecten maximus TaxID=6579 RepID=UPI0014591793|nr:vacuolar protein sorting-associated protein 13B-like isoform X2 [Pecten maximus]